ncbi:hypothetical protein MUK42_06557 [Musa troglodytarum]|uniref:Uncharacterized protein n=1 Tax=Musa troglodytarum TaxID=320322 RepID=A0A9E7H4A2_9LILI|nr:hypothetical protein MUK42_06557 [Musa troglodytarum]
MRLRKVGRRLVGCGHRVGSAGSSYELARVGRTTVGAVTDGLGTGDRTVTIAMDARSVSGTDETVTSAYQVAPRFALFLGGRSGSEKGRKIERLEVSGCWVSFTR